LSIVPKNPVYRKMGKMRCQHRPRRGRDRGGGKESEKGGPLSIYRKPQQLRRIKGEKKKKVQF